MYKHTRRAELDMYNWKEWASRQREASRRSWPQAELRQATTIITTRSVFHWMCTKRTVQIRGAEVLISLLDYYLSPSNLTQLLGEQFKNSLYGLYTLLKYNNFWSIKIWIKLLSPRTAFGSKEPISIPGLLKKTAEEVRNNSDSIPKKLFTNLTFQNPHVPALKTREPKTGVEVSDFGSEKNVVVETHSKKWE